MSISVDGYKSFRGIEAAGSGGTLNTAFYSQLLNVASSFVAAYLSRSNDVLTPEDESNNTIETAVYFFTAALEMRSPGFQHIKNFSFPGNFRIEYESGENDNRTYESLMKMVSQLLWRFLDPEDWISLSSDDTSKTQVDLQKIQTIYERIGEITGLTFYTTDARNRRQPKINWQRTGVTIPSGTKFFLHNYTQDETLGTKFVYFDWVPVLDLPVAVEGQPSSNSYPVIGGLWGGYNTQSGEDKFPLRVGRSATGELMLASGRTVRVSSSPTYNFDFEIRRLVVREVE